MRAGWPRPQASECGSRRLFSGVFSRFGHPLHRGSDHADRFSFFSIFQSFSVSFTPSLPLCSAHASLSAAFCGQGLQRRSPRPSHQNGEAITEVVSTNLVRPGFRANPQKSSEKTGDARRRRLLAPAGAWRPTGQVPVPSAVHLSTFVSFVSLSSYPPPIVQRARSFVPHRT